MDADIVVMRRINDLYDIDISDTFLAAIDNPGINNNDELGMKSSPNILIPELCY